MRKILTGSLLLTGLLLGSASHAQTWASPVNLAGSTTTVAFDTCSLPSEQLYVEYSAFSFFAPVAVYRIISLQVGRLPMLHPYALTLQPYGWDASLWVCRQRQGNQLNDCEDGSDNWGVGTNEFATVPATVGTHYIVVTANSDNIWPICGQILLTAHRY
jgi:hypothetical protein